MAGLSRRDKLNVAQSQRSSEVASTRKGWDKLMDSRRVARAAWSRSASHHELLRGELGISSSQGGNGSYFESCRSKGLQILFFFFSFSFQLSLSQRRPFPSRGDAERILGEGRWQPQGCWKTLQESSTATCQALGFWRCSLLVSPAHSCGCAPSRGAVRALWHATHPSQSLHRRAPRA